MSWLVFFPMESVTEFIDFAVETGVLDGRPVGKRVR